MRERFSADKVKFRAFCLRARAASFRSDGVALGWRANFRWSVDTDRSETSPHSNEHTPRDGGGASENAARLHCRQCHSLVARNVLGMRDRRAALIARRCHLSATGLCLLVTVCMAINS